jgi:mono/diheme cytochrome c family protein
VSPSASPHAQTNNRTNVRRLGRWAMYAAGVGVIGLLGFAAFAWRLAIPEIATPLPSSFDAGVVARGAMLSSVGYCATCHSVKGGQPFATP